MSVRAAGLLLLAALPVRAGAQTGMDGEELYGDYFGCWTCHGQVGEGGEGQPLRETYLPLSLFIKTLRLPAGEMPVFNDLLATDAELATVYAWLEGVDNLVLPPPMTLTLEGGGSVASGAEVELYLRAIRTDAPVGDPDPARFRYRLTLFERDNSLLADLPMRWSTDGDRWSTFQTDRYGQALLGPEGGVDLADLSPVSDVTDRVRVELPSGSYVLVAEAVDANGSAEAAIYGVATAVIRVE